MKKIISYDLLKKSFVICYYLFFYEFSWFFIRPDPEVFYISKKKFTNYYCVPQNDQIRYFYFNLFSIFPAVQNCAFRVTWHLTMREDASTK